MHFYYNSRKTPWGIYLFPQLLFEQANKLHKIFGPKFGISQKDMQYAYTYAVYRHEMFHHQVERFATKYEILKNEVIYRKYKASVYNYTKHSKDWLEEALAEATVLKSVHVHRNISLKPKQFKAIYEHDLKSMPPGYRDYECWKFGGPEDAHKLLASQIIQADPYAKPSSAICTVTANENKIKFNNIPLYTVIIKGLERVDDPKDAMNLYLNFMGL